MYGSGPERGSLGERVALKEVYKVQEEDKGLLETGRSQRIENRLTRRWGQRR